MIEGQTQHRHAHVHDGIGDSLWQACVDQLAQELSEQQFNTWIKPLTAQVADDLSRVTVFVANRFKLDWIRAQYAGKIASMAEKLYGQPVAIELALAPVKCPCGLYQWPHWSKLMCRATSSAWARSRPAPASRTGSTPA